MKTSATTELLTINVRNAHQINCVNKALTGVSKESCRDSNSSEKIGKKFDFAADTITLDPLQILVAAVPIADRTTKNDNILDTSSP